MEVPDAAAAETWLGSTVALVALPPGASLSGGSGGTIGVPAAVDAVWSLVGQDLHLRHDLGAELLHAMDQRVARVHVLVGLERDIVAPNRRSHGSSRRGLAAPAKACWRRH